MSDRKFGLSGLTMSSLKKNPAILPIYVLTGAGLGLAAYYVYRLATKSPEVTWNKRKNPEPWNDYTNKQYKFIASGRDYNEPSPAPAYK